MFTMYCLLQIINDHEDTYHLIFDNTIHITIIEHGPVTVLGVSLLVTHSKPIDNKCYNVLYHVKV